jgi:hypothetical protein
MLKCPRFSILNLMQVVVALTVPLAMWSWKLKYRHDSVFDSVILGICAISACTIGYAFFRSARKDRRCLRRAVIGLWVAYFLTALWFCSVEWYWFFDDCPHCGNSRSIYQYRFLSRVIKSNVGNWNEPGTIEAIASDIGIPCSHAGASRVLHQRVCGLCVVVEDPGTIRLQPGTWYPPCARDAIRSWAAREPAFVSTFRKRVMEQHDVTYLRDLRRKLRDACEAAEFLPAKSRISTGEK